MNCAGDDLASLMKNLQNGDVFTASYDVCKLSESGKVLMHICILIT